MRVANVQEVLLTAVIGRLVNAALLILLVASASGPAMAAELCFLMFSTSLRRHRLRPILPGRGGGFPFRRQV